MSKNSKTSSKIFATLVLLLSFAFCILCADLCSSIITVGSFSISGNGIKISSFDIYAISLSASASKVQAEESATTFKAQGSAGYVWNIDNTFNVLASAYLNESDAKKVSEKLTANNVNNTVIKISFDEIAISGEFSSQERNILISSLNSFKTTYEKLYDASVSLDTQISNDIQTKIAIGNIKSEIVKIKSDFDSVFTAKITNALLQLKLKLGEIINILDKLSEKQNSLSAEIKYSYFDCLNLYTKLYDEINKKD